MAEYPLDPTGVPIVGPGAEVERAERLIFYLALIGAIGPEEHKELRNRHILRGIAEGLVQGLARGGTVPLKTLARGAKRLFKLQRFGGGNKGCSLHLTKDIVVEPGELSQTDLSRRERNSVFMRAMEEKAPRWNRQLAETNDEGLRAQFYDEIICSGYYRGLVIDEVDRRLRSKR